MHSSMTQCTLPQILARQAEAFGNEFTAIREKAYGIWQTYSWQDYFNYVKRTGLGFSALGLRRGDHIGIVTDNIPEWLFSELGGQSVGGITLNLFTSSITEELCFALNRMQAAYVVVQDQEQVDKLLDGRDRLPHVRNVIYIDKTGMASYQDEPWLLSFSSLLERGDALDQKNPDFFPNELRKGNPDNIALMIQTSGTTGVSKLAMLSHRNMAEIARSWMEALPIHRGDNWMSISPPAWIVDQMWGVGVSLLSGMTMNFPETTETVAEDFREIGPAIIITSSRFWEDMASAVMLKMADSGWIKRKLFQLSVHIGRKIIDLKYRKKAVSPLFKILHWIASIVIYHPLLDRIGCSRFKNAFTGGHPISPDVIRFFRAIGLNLKQCYGLTEAGGIFQIQPDDEVKPETVGKPLPGVLMKIADDQEVLIRSGANFMGYYQDFKATEEAFIDGWLKTGDAGYIDKDGHLLIIGRKADIIKNKGGEAFSPDFIETRLKFSPFIKEAVMFGEGRPYITALINIDMGNVGNWAEERMIPYTTYIDLSQQTAVEEMIFGEVSQVNDQLPDVMKIRKFILLYKLLDADDDELTRTGKVRRRFIYGLYIKLIEAMYSDLKEIDVRGKVRYRDGQIGEIETKVKIINMF
jgi:long-chain acyl-CoA synthetase